MQKGYSKRQENSIVKGEFFLEKIKYLDQTNEKWIETDSIRRNCGKKYVEYCDYARSMFGLVNC